MQKEVHRMANIVEKIRQIRQAVYGKDVRESIASSLEEMNKDNIKATQDANSAIASANEAIDSANTAADNANTKAGEASSAAQAANEAASSANTAAQGANTATTNANNAAEAANDIAEEIERQLRAGELKGDPGSRTLYGSGAPLISIGNVGDWYYDTTSQYWDVYYKQSDALWVKMGQIKGSLGGDTVPIGAMIPSTTSTVPAGWLLCDGSLVSRTEYSELFAVIGETYGAGDGETTFALPNEPNPLAHTIEDNAIQFVEREPVLYMIIKAKQVIPVTGGIVNDPNCNSETDALSALATKSAIEQTASQIPNLNLLINSDFQVWQRGTTFESVNTIYTADRCLSNASLVGAMTIRKVADGLQFTCTKSGAQLAPYQYLMEDADLKKVRGKTVTLSYSVDGVIRSFTLNDFGQVYILNDELLEDYTLPSTAGNLTHTAIVILYENMTVGQSKTINWVKLEYGSLATPFVPRLYSEELMECMRYYRIVNTQGSLAYTNANASTLIIPIGSSIPWYKTPSISGTELPPSITIRGDGAEKLFYPTNVSVKDYGNNNMYISFSGTTTGAANTIFYIVSGGADIRLDAEIY